MCYAIDMGKTMKTEKIETIKKRYHREWLLIAVDKIDEATTTPISGKLITHSPHRDEVYTKLMALKKRQDILVEYSEDKLPRGFAAAF
ncbi:hypothetical protein LDC_1311 [sediment metagenome]|uniref:Uncharacterized protein n=1 Tax=sediment metagenome TaxID=749907 RepID=D9PIF3_9ZZZZ